MVDDIVRNWILDGIESGGISAGGKLPGAREIAAREKTLTVRMDEEGIAFGENAETVFPYGSFPVRVYEDMMICELPGMQIFFLPRRAAVDEMQWREAVRRLERL